MKRKAWLAFLLAALLVLPVCARADDWEDGDGYYTVYTEQGGELFTFSGGVSVDDEYISGDNQCYRITTVDTANHTATATWVGAEEMPDVSWLKADNVLPVSAGDTRKRIAMYMTHTDESYVPTDGASSLTEGGIIDVAETLKASLESRGVEVLLDKTSHLPHDAGAYRRSRQTAVSLMEKAPDALLDIHRDGTPAKEYTTQIDGENASKVRLLVGRANQNSAANKEFAKQIKSVADAEYPGLIKDIFIGKGTYNQELMPRAILLEMGTHELSKARVEKSADMIADVITTTLYGGVSGAARTQGDTPAQNTGVKGSDAGTGRGMVWLLVAVIGAGILFALLATGGGKGMMTKLKRNTSEVTGGLFGKRPDKGD